MTQTTAVKCANCGAAVPASSMNIQEMVAVCPECDHIFRLQAVVNTLENSSQRKVKIPEHYEVQDADGELQISYLHRKVMTGVDKIAYGFMSLFLLFFLAFAVFLSVQGDTAASVLGVFFVLVSFIPMYLLAAAGLNRRQITLDDQLLAWRDVPLPVPWNAHFYTNEIEHIIAQPSKAGKELGTEDYYEIVVHRYDGSKSTFLDMVDRKKAQYIQQTLEAHLRGDVVDAHALDSEAEALAEDVTNVPFDTHEEARHRLNGSV